MHKFESDERGLMYAKPYAFGSYEELEAVANEFFTIKNVAQHHSRVSRWNGHTSDSITGPSLALHTIAMANAAKTLGYDEETQLLCLVHDAEEMLTGDIPAPYKRTLVNRDELDKLSALVLGEFFNGSPSRYARIAMRKLDDEAWKVESELMREEKVHTDNPELYDVVKRAYLQLQQDVFHDVALRFESESEVPLREFHTMPMKVINAMLLPYKMEMYEKKFLEKYKELTDA